jgi:hypothetical protein
MKNVYTPIFITVFLFLLPLIALAQADSSLVLSSGFPMLNQDNYDVKITWITGQNLFLITWINADMIQNRIQGAIVNINGDMKVRRSFLLTRRIPNYEVESYDIAYNDKLKKFLLVWSERKGTNNGRIRYVIKGSWKASNGDKLGKDFKLRGSEKYSYEYPLVSSLFGNKRFAFGYSEVPMNITGSENMEKLKLAKLDENHETVLEETVLEKKIRSAAAYGNIMPVKMITMDNDRFVLVGVLYPNNTSIGGRIFLNLTSVNFDDKYWFITSEKAPEAIWPSLAFNGATYQLTYSLVASGNVQSNSLFANLKRQKRLKIKLPSYALIPSESIFLPNRSRAIIFQDGQEIRFWQLSEPGKKLGEGTLLQLEEDEYLLSMRAFMLDKFIYLAVIRYSEELGGQVEFIKYPEQTFYIN